MYRTDDLIIYGSGSVCRVEAITSGADLPGGDKTKQYYTLQPLFDNGVIRVPVDAKVFMRPVVSGADANALLDAIPTLETQTDLNISSPQLLSERYRAFFATHECRDLLLLVKAAHEKGKRAAAHGKHLGRTDQHFYQRARALLEQEFSVAMGLSTAEIAAYIDKGLEA